MKYIGTCTLEVDSPHIPQNIELVRDSPFLINLEDVRFYSSYDDCDNNSSDDGLKPALESFVAQKSMKLTELVDFAQVPFWFFDMSSPTSVEYRCFTENENTEEFFRKLVNISISSNTILTLLFDAKHPTDIFEDTNNGDYSLAIYPKLIHIKDDQSGCLSKNVAICASLLNFKTPIALTLNRVRALAESGQVTLPSNRSARSVFVELDTVSKKRDKFFDNYLKKRSVSRQQSVSREDSVDPENASVRMNTEANFHEQFFDLLDRCILSEFRMRGVSKSLSKSELDELYALISRSAKFIFRTELKKKIIPSLDAIGDVVTSMVSILSQGERRNFGKVSESCSAKR